MINLDKHTIHLGTGDVDIDIIETSRGKPVIAFSNTGDGVGQNSVFMGFASGESIDSMISFLRSLRRNYYPVSQAPLSSTQSFRIYTEDKDT